MDFGLLQHNLGTRIVDHKRLEEYMLTAGKEDNYSENLGVKQEIYATLKARDPEFTPVGYDLHDWLPSFAEFMGIPSVEHFGLEVAR